MLFKKQKENINKIVNIPFIKQLSVIFTDAGKDLYLVGGSVRDAILGFAHEDLDFTTNARPNEIREIVKKYADQIFDVGARFGTIGIVKGDHKAEITTFRSEIYNRDSRNPEVTYSDNINDDLIRRDFTINSIAIKLPDVEFVDPYGGFKDLAKGIIKTPRSATKSFSDDPLRMLRAARFSSVLGFKIDSEVVKAMADMYERLSIISKERIRDELSKLLMSNDPVKGLRIMVESKIADYVVPELPRLKMEIQPQFHHKDVLEHTYKVVAGVPADLTLRLAALLHDIAKPQTKILVKGEVHFYGHDVIGARMARKRLFELRYPKQVIKDATELIRLHLRPYSYGMGWTDHAVRRYARDAGNLLYKLNALAIADCTTQIPYKAKKNLEQVKDLERRIKILEEEEESAKIRPPVDGNEVMKYLGMQPGPQLGNIMKMLLEARLEGKIKTKEEAYLLLDKEVRG